MAVCSGVGRYLPGPRPLAPGPRMTVDLNCDMGELEDARHEAALMEYITSANIACGGHAGDEASMERTARLAIVRGVRIGAEGDSCLVFAYTV